MKKELTISERGELAQQLTHKDHFYTDLNLYNKQFPGSKLSVQLSKANEHNQSSLHGRMLYELLSRVDHDDVLLNRETPEEKEARIQEETNALEAAKQLTLDRVKLAVITLLIANESTDEEILESIFKSPLQDGEVPVDIEVLTTFVNETIISWKEENEDTEENSTDETNVNESEIKEADVKPAEVKATVVEPAIVETPVVETKVSETKAKEPVQKKSGKKTKNSRK